MRPMTAGERLSLLLPVAYILGSIPFGVIVGRLKGKDITRHGSGNIGATNVGRLLGRKYFYIVFFLDMFKGLLPMVFASILLSDQKLTPTGGHPTNVYVLWLAIGFAAIIGHMFTVFLRFKGGKGIATSLGVILGLYPYLTLPGLVIFAMWLVVFAAFRYISLASITAAGAFPLAYVGVGLWRKWDVFGEQLPLLIFSIVVAALILYKHRGNMRRLMQGKEPHYHHHRKDGEESAEHHHRREDA